MSQHNTSVFKNSCVKTPIHPASRLPTPHYERSKSFENPFEINTKEVNENPSKDKKSFMSLVDFYESIPDYSDINHLSERDFNKQIDKLKKKQMEIQNNFFPDKHFNKNHYFEDEITKNRSEFSKSPVKFSLRDEDNESWNQKNLKKSVRINSAKSGESVTFRPGTPFISISEPEEDLYASARNGRSKSCSPVRCSVSPKVTIPKPFQMTQREEEERMYEDLLLETSRTFTPEEDTKSKKDTQFKANPVPLTSKIPLLKHIMSEKEHKSQLAKLNSTMELQSQMKPFSFTETSEKRTNNRCLSRSSSVDNPKKNFRAKPCPKNLYSNYFYNKMWEDDYFRAMNRQIRADELLKDSCLPPAMAKRDNKPNKSLRSESSVSVNSVKKKKRKKRPLKKNTDFPAAPSSYDSGSFMPSPVPIYPAGRPNLAANLRAEVSRKKIYEFDHENDRKPSAGSRRFDWDVKKSPAWKSLYYDETHQEDLSLRLATRRAEQKLREAEYSLMMEVMKNRVKKTPLLLEGPTHWGPRAGQSSHSCARDAKEKMKKLRRERPSSCPRNTASKLSNYSEGKSSTKNCKRRDYLDELYSIDDDLL